MWCEVRLFDKPPLLDQNITDATITPSATTGSITLTASEPLFDKKLPSRIMEMTITTNGVMQFGDLGLIYGMLWRMAKIWT